MLRKMKNSVIFLVSLLILMSAITMTSFAGQWKQDSVGWWYQNDDGSYPSNGWYWLDGNNDGIAECYYFDARGYMLANTVTPDGYTVNASGQWTENSVVQTKASGVVSQETGKKEPREVVIPRSRLNEMMNKITLTTDNWNDYFELIEEEYVPVEINAYGESIVKVGEKVKKLYIKLKEGVTACGDFPFTFELGGTETRTAWYGDANDTMESIMQTSPSVSKTNLGGEVTRWFSSNWCSSSVVTLYELTREPRNSVKENVVENVTFELKRVMGEIAKVELHPEDLSIDKNGNEYYLCEISDEEYLYLYSKYIDEVGKETRGVTRKWKGRSGEWSESFIEYDEESRNLFTHLYSELIQ